MKVLIETVDIDAAKARAAEAEMRRLAERMEPGYYKRVAEGDMPRELANARLGAMASAILICQAAAIALEEAAAAAARQPDLASAAARPGQEPLQDLCLYGQPDLASAAARPAGTAGPALALSLPELPYDKGDAVAAEAPRCRFCLQPGTQAAKLGGDYWRCSREGCPGHGGWVRRNIFEGGAA